MRGSREIGPTEHVGHSQWPWLVLRLEVRRRAQPRPEDPGHGPVDPSLDRAPWCRAAQEGIGVSRPVNNARLRRLMGHVDHLDGFEEQLDRYDLDDDGWDGMVEDRRAADKVAPLIRWAEAHITLCPVLAGGDYWARRNHFAALLGDTVIGRHALGHLDHLFGEENPWCGCTTRAVPPGGGPPTSSRRPSRRARHASSPAQ